MTKDNWRQIKADEQAVKNLEKFSKQEQPQTTAQIKQIEQYIKKYCLNDTELMNLSINMSIIKHNEFKSASRTAGPKQPRSGDIAVENLEFAMVDDPMKSQDYQMAINKVERKKRAIFMEGTNEYVHDMNEYVMFNYAEQIK